MKTKILLTVTVLFLILSAIGQKATIELTFTAINNATYVQLDSIKVMNQTQGGDTVLYWPDTVLILEYFPVGVPELNPDQERLRVFQNYPNPAVDQTIISLFIPEKDNVKMIISDILGRTIIRAERELERGYHAFRFIPGRGDIFFFTACWKGTSSSIKILHTSTGGMHAGSLEYLGIDQNDRHPLIKSGIQNFEYDIGDKMVYSGYNDNLESYLLDSLKTEENYTFQFGYDFPCPGLDSILYEGQWYNTVQIFNQCWLKENLNVGTMIPGIQEMSDDSIVEKYCFTNDPVNCSTVGALYQWAEAVRYLNGATNTTSWTPVPTGYVTGICPPGWHIPTDEEWKILEGETDSYYGYPDPEWDGTDYRGLNVGNRLKAQTHWFNNGTGSDFVGLSVLGSGARRFDGVFMSWGTYTSIWSSSEGDALGAWYRYMESNSFKVSRTYNLKTMGRPVRCIKDD